MGQDGGRRAHELSSRSERLQRGRTADKEKTSSGRLREWLVDTVIKEPSPNCCPMPFRWSMTYFRGWRHVDKEPGSERENADRWGRSCR